MKMNKIILITISLILASCGLSSEEKKNIAAVTCSIMGETRNMDAAVRVEKLNNAREKIGGEPFLGGDDAIKEAFKYGLCEELVLNENYNETLQIALEEEFKRLQIAAEKQAEKKRISDAKPSVKEESHPNGKLKKRTNYQSVNDGGKKHGLEEYYSENGQLMDKLNFKDGELDGLYETYYENGELNGTLCWKNGEITDDSYCKPQ